MQPIIMLNFIFSLNTINPHIIPQITTIDLLKNAVVNEVVFNILCHSKAYSPSKIIDIANKAMNLNDSSSLLDANLTNKELKEYIKKVICNITKLIIRLFFIFN
jgi:hypothetical protein